MEIESLSKNGALIITPIDQRLDAEVTSLFKEKVIDMVSDAHIDQVIFDLHNLNFIDSSGLSSFLSILRQLNNLGGDLKLAELNRPIQTMFELVSMHKSFEIYSTVNEALASLSQNKDTISTMFF